MAAPLPVSIVTPVYNTESYLAECIESVLKQTHDDWEYVIVNNCSTDRSLEIARHYAQRDARIRIHNNSRFLDQMQNLNHAFRQISPHSKYCKVVHADDWIFPDCLRRMVEVGEAHPSVGIIGAYRLDEVTVNLDGLVYPSPVTPGRDICRRYLLEGLSVFGSPTSLLLRSDLIRNRERFYNESNLHADIEVCFDILQNADFGFVHQVLTYTRRHNESASTKRSVVFGTGLASNLLILNKYGPVYLSKEEHKIAHELLIKQYYRFLGWSIFRLRKPQFRSKRKEFFAYHKESLGQLGYRIKWAKVFKASLIVLAIHLSNRLAAD